MSKTFKGVFIALTTPFEGDEICLEKFKENIQKYDEFDLSGYVVAGSTGESVFLTDRETEQLVRAAKESVSGGKKIIAGTERESTKNTLEFTNKLAEFGIDAALIRTPSYYKSLMSEEALKKHYLTLADQSKVPLIVYHIPRNTGISIESHLIVELSRHPQIAGIKDSSGNLALLGEAIPHLPPQFSYLLGAGSLFFSGLNLGASGGILALAALAPGQCVEIYRLFQNGKREEALDLQLSLVPLNKAIIQTYGIPAIKYALDLLGFHGGSLRLPLLPLGEKGKQEMERILRELKMLE